MGEDTASQPSDYMVIAETGRGDSNCNCRYRLVNSVGTDHELSPSDHMVIANTHRGD